MGSVLIVVCTMVTGVGMSAAGARPTTTGASGHPPGARDDIPSAGCGTSKIGAGEENVTTTSGGVERTYIRHVPPQHDGTHPLPLIISIHGLGEGASLHTRTTEWGPRADEHGFVVVFPQGINSLWDPSPEGPDVAYIGHVLDEVEATLCVDMNRVYVSGFSLGAFMTSAVACVYADRVAAVAPVAGISDFDGCAPARPVPVITFHGTADNWVDYDRFHVERNVAAWAERNGCGTPPTSTSVPGDDVVTIDKFDYPCPPGAEVEFYRITKGGHAWPGSEFSRLIVKAVGYTTFAITASDLIWDFFSAHQLHSAFETRFIRLEQRLDMLSARLEERLHSIFEDFPRPGARPPVVGVG
jgi:polyhydroxybutyrate depolymerase